jgi:pimeloyl-ACP methyl ester carboxylesterase
MLKKILLIGFPILILLAVLGFVIWGSTPLPASAEAVQALQSNPAVKIETVQGWTVFRPAAGAQTGFIFYPGGRVDYRAYAPLLSQIAAQGYLVVLTPMPLNLAVFGIETAQQVVSAFPEIKHWAVGGHSLGGSMAAQFVLNHPGAMAGLVFWASYPASSMVDSSVQVVSISASNDGLATPAKIEDSRKLLPGTTRFVAIAGGVHAQFGSYGAQPGDGIATIAPAAQWEQTVKASVELLKSISQ